MLLKRSKWEFVGGQDKTIALVVQAGSAFFDLRDTRSGSVVRMNFVSVGGFLGASGGRLAKAIRKVYEVKTKGKIGSLLSFPVGKIWVTPLAPAAEPLTMFTSGIFLIWRAEAHAVLGGSLWLVTWGGVGSFSLPPALPIGLAPGGHPLLTAIGVLRSAGISLAPAAGAGYLWCRVTTVNFV